MEVELIRKYQTIIQLLFNIINKSSKTMSLREVIRIPKYKKEINLLYTDKEVEEALNHYLN